MGVRLDRRGVAHPLLIGIGALVLLILAIVIFVLFPAFVLALLLLLFGFALTVAAAMRFPGTMKWVGVIAGIVLMLLGAILAIVATVAGPLAL